MKNERNNLNKAWQEQLFRHFEGGFLEMFVNLLAITMSLLLTFSCWVWWRSDVTLKDGLMMASISLIVHLILTYETGYKRAFRVGQPRYFYVVWLVPALLSVVGFVGGLFYREIL